MEFQPVRTHRAWTVLPSLPRGHDNLGADKTRQSLNAGERVHAAKRRASFLKRKRRAAIIAVLTFPAGNQSDYVSRGRLTVTFAATTNVETWTNMYASRTAEPSVYILTGWSARCLEHVAGIFF